VILLHEGNNPMDKATAFRIDTSWIGSLIANPISSIHILEIILSLCPYRSIGILIVSDCGLGRSNESASQGDFSRHLGLMHPLAMFA